MCKKKYHVKYHLLMLNPFQKAIIAIEDNISRAQLIACLEKRLKAYFNDYKTRYPRSMFSINFKIVKK